MERLGVQSSTFSTTHEIGFRYYLTIRQGAQTYFIESAIIRIIIAIIFECKGRRSLSLFQHTRQYAPPLAYHRLNKINWQGRQDSNLRCVIPGSKPGAIGLSVHTPTNLHFRFGDPTGNRTPTSGQTVQYHSHQNMGPYVNAGGSSRIRTYGAITDSFVQQTNAIGLSAILPYGGVYSLSMSKHKYRGINNLRRIL